MLEIIWVPVLLAFVCLAFYFMVNNAVAQDELHRLENEKAQNRIDALERDLDAETLKNQQNRQKIEGLEKVNGLLTKRITEYDRRNVLAITEISDQELKNQQANAKCKKLETKNRQLQAEVFNMRNNKWAIEKALEKYAKNAAKSNNATTKIDQTNNNEQHRNVSAAKALALIGRSLHLQEIRKHFHKSSGASNDDEQMKMEFVSTYLTTNDSGRVKDAYAALFAAYQNDFVCGACPHGSNTEPSEICMLRNPERICACHNSNSIPHCVEHCAFVAAIATERNGHNQMSEEINEPGREGCFDNGQEKELIDEHNDDGFAVVESDPEL